MPRIASLLGTAVAAPEATVPTWLRRAVPDAQSLAAHSLKDVALAAGAALDALDNVVRRQERWGGTWRQRLALTAASVTAQQVGRVEDEAALRDAVLLTKLGDDVGPSGRMLLAWRRLAGMPAEKLLSEASIGAVLDDLGLRCDDDTVGDLAAELRALSAGGMIDMVVGTFTAADRYGFGRTTGAWLADALLAQRLGWTHAIPLLGTEVVSGIGASRSRRSTTVSPVAGFEPESDRTKSLLAAQARAALRAIDLAAELERRSDRLLAVAPKLRAKAADTVVERLLSYDAIVASEKVSGMSDRGLRRLFDRLVELGAVRELSGRPTFRIYGL